MFYNMIYSLHQMRTAKGAMMELFQTAETLFESFDNDESLRITCSLTDAGSLLIDQVSEGPVTQWCFEESPHRVLVEVEPEGASRLASHFKAVETEQLPRLLGASFTGYDTSAQIRDLMRELGIPYQVHERAIVR